MRYADAGVCPSCRNFLPQNAKTCNYCGLALTTAEAAQVWQALLAVDHKIMLAHQRSQALQGAFVAASPRQPSYTPAGPAYKPLPPANSYAKKPGVKIDTILLALGGLFILVAGSIVSALVLGPLGLALMAVVAAFMARFAHGKNLRSATETLTSIALGLATITFATTAGSIATVGPLLWPALLFLLACIVTKILWDKNVALLTPQMTAAVALCLFSFNWLTLSNTTDNFFWVLLFASLWSFVGVGLAHKLRLKWPLRLLLACTALQVFLLEITALVTYGDQSLQSLATGASWPLATMILLFTGIYALSTFTLVKSPALRAGSTLLASLLLFNVWVAIVWPAELMALYGSTLATSVFATVLLLLPLKLPGQKWAAALAAAVGFLLILSQALPLTTEMLPALTAYNTLAFWEPASVPIFLPFTVVLPSLLLSWCLYALSFKASSEKLQSYAQSMLVASWASTIMLITLLLWPAPLGLALVLTAAGLALQLQEPRWASFAVGLVLVAPISAVSSLDALVASLCLASAATVYLLPPLKNALKTFATALALLYPVTAASLSLMDVDGSAVLFVLLYLTTAALGLLTLMLAETKLAEASLTGVKIAVGITIISALAASLLGGPLTAPITFAVAGALLIGYSFSSASLPWRACGGLLLAIAWWLRLWSSQVTAVELYTLPIGLVLLLLGIYVLWKNRTLASLPVAGPGLALTFLPSLTLLMQEPSLLRTLILIFAALACLLGGMAARLQAFFLAGALVAGIIALWELSPLLAEIHRWIYIGGAGILLFAVGATWEKRVMEGKTALAYVKNLR